MRLPVQHLLGLLVCLAGGIAHAQTAQMTLTVPPSFSTATFGLPNTEITLQPQVTLTSGVGTSLSGPVTVNFVLPEHVSYVGFSGHPQWSCSGSAQTASCSWNQTLTSNLPNTSFLSLQVDVSAALPVPGSSIVQATLAHPNLPAPNIANCVQSPNNSGVTTNGCIRTTSTHVRSMVQITQAFWQNSAIFVIGSEAQFRIGFQNIGFGFNNGQVTARFQLPPGLVYSRIQGAIPATWSCSAAAVNSDGQLLTCNVPGMFDGQTASTQNFNVIVNVTPAVAVPGPVPILATVSNAQQPPPDIATCSQMPLALGCGFHQVPTQAPVQARMDILSMSHSPASFAHGEEGVLTVSFGNIGNGSAGAISLRLATPPGMAFNRATGAMPSGSCSASGVPTTGQTVTCNFAAGLAASASGLVNLVFDLTSRTASPARVVAAIDDASNPGPTLTICAATPTAIGCDEDFIAIFAGIFCDGLEPERRVCRFTLQNSPTAGFDAQ